ncbi:hypothetical protein BpHYR1_029623 [Brachionus plicatilis]|uniref:Transmembrane protein n=1 Tax=Brachionus plicatilis TaxID=10195 RepID=A0A3M7RBS4_BRAPC|nr:hypothetical protein BpHYR1_029623 [Brachionus plicatilis]
MHLLILVCLYGANILTFIYQCVSNENDESLSFCFWFSLIGFFATLLSISFFLVNFNKNNSENKDRNQDYQSIIMSHITKRQPFDEIVNVNMTHSESEQTLTKSITVRNLTQFKFQQLYEFLFGKIRTIVSNKSCLKSNQGSVKSCDDSNATTVYTNSSKIQICPLHSLVLPTVKKNSGFQHTKMMVLPFGRLSGVHNKMESNNCNE